MKTFRWNHKGFTLAEMAIVVLLGSIMLTMGVKMFTAIKDHSAYSDTRSKQDTIKTALVGYLRNNGRMPCPDTNLPPDGVENRTGASPNDTCLGNNGYGVVPYVSLGLARESVLDGWGNYFTYRVATANNGNGPTASIPRFNNVSSANQNWTVKGGAANAFDINSLTTKANDAGYTTRTITIADANGDISYSTIAVILSHGKNGFGAATVKSNSRMPSVSATAQEIVNATHTPATMSFRKLDIQPQNGFDDLVMFLTPQDLLQPLIDEGTLKTCYAYCRSSSSAALEATCTPNGTFNCTANGTPTCSAAGATPTCSTGAPHCTSSGTPTCAASTSTEPAGPGCTTEFSVPIGANPGFNCL